MAEYEVVPSDRLQAVARWISSWTWPMGEDESVASAIAFGRSVVDRDDGRGETYDTGLLRERSWADVRIKGGEVREVTIVTSPVVHDALPEGPHHVTDVFAEQVQAVSAVLGPPARQEAGSSGSVTWDLPSGASLRVGRTSRSCAWSVDSPDFVQLQRDVRDIENEQA